MKMRLLLAIAGFVILVVHGAVFYDQFFHEWERYQTAYFDQARSMSKTDAERASFDGRKPQIEQLLITRFGDARVDRCTTCHAAIDDPRFESYAEPLKSHPYSESLGDRKVDGTWERRHKFSDFGCTVCHAGQGRGLEAFDAHGNDHFWPEPMLGYVTQANWRADFKDRLVGADYMQSNCVQCHTDAAFSSTPLVTRGRELFVQKNCYGCHKIEGIANGTLGPDLSEVGKKFKNDYIWESIVDPRANLKTSFMPRFNLTDDEVKSLVVFLKSRRGVNFAETSLDRYRQSLTAVAPMPPGGVSPVAEDTVARGERLLGERACLACHKIGDKDGGIAPDLSFEGLVREETWLVEHFRNPRSRMPDSIMPSFAFPETDFSAISKYLLSLTKPPQYANASEIFTNSCARCHGEKGDGQGPIAIYLDPAPRDFTKASFFTSRPSDRFIQSIKNGVPGTSMPPLARVFSEAQIQDVFAYVETNFVREPRRELRPRDLPDENPVAATDDSIQRGAQTFAMRCTGCHGRKADGKGPNALDIVPRPRNLLNRDFIHSIPDRRMFESILYGVQGTAMPSWIDYGMTKNDVSDLVNYIRSLNGPPAGGGR
jgi:sulfur oxidation c-type cytochrome SoxX